MLIREMRSNDLDLVIKFEIEYRNLDKAIIIPFVEERYREKFTEKKIEDYVNNKTLLYIENDRIIGLITLLFQVSLANFKKIGYIDWITVLKPYRNKGIAKQLLLEAESYFRYEQCELYYLFVDKTEVAKGFYDNIKLKQEDIIRGYKILD